jgi:GT2 family glycosyltransferase
VERTRLAAVIVNYRTPELSLRALDSLLPELDADRDEVVLVENGSADDSSERLQSGVRRRAPSVAVRVVSARHNRGYSAGVNLGLRAADADHYLVLNSDVIVREGAVSAFLARAEACPRPALVAPRLEGPDSDAQISSFRYPSPLGELVEAAGTGPIARLFARHAIANPAAPPDAERWVSFAAVLISRASIERVGLMDEDFFMFFEDVDYCRRVQASGGSIVDCPEARIVHLRGASSPVKRLREQRKRLPTYFYESRSRYFTKHLGRSTLWLANAFWLLGQGIAAARELAGRPRHNARGSVRDIWRGALKPVTSPGA